MKSLSRGRLALATGTWRIVRKCKSHPAPAELLCCLCGLVGTYCSTAVVLLWQCRWWWWWWWLLRLFLKEKNRLSVVMTSPSQCQCCVCSSSCRMAAAVDTTAAVLPFLAGLSPASAPAAAAAAATAVCCCCWCCSHSLLCMFQNFSAYSCVVFITMYHAVCKDEFQPFNRSYSELMFFTFIFRIIYFFQV